MNKTRRSSAPLATQLGPVCAIGVDVGGTKIAAGLVQFPDGKILVRLRNPTLPKRGGAAVLDDVTRLIKELSAQAQARPLRMAGVGLGVCELVDLAGNVVSSHTIAWKGVPVQERLEQTAPAIVEADVRAAALGEALFGAGKDFRSFLYVTIGTGISSCLVLDGKPFAGSRGATGTMASSPLDVVCDKCGVVEHRTLEEIAAGPTLVENYHRRSTQRLKSAEDVLSAARTGDPIAIAVVASAATALGASIGLLVNVLDPEAIVIGGGLGLSGGIYWEHLMASIRRHVWSELHRDLPILPAATGTDAGIIGAAATAWQRLRRDN